MKALSTSVKSILAASALAAGGGANATVWNVSMNADVFFSAANGPLQMTGFSGTWDDATNVGVWTGTTSIPTFQTTLHYTQTFTMNEFDGQGTLTPLALTTCTDNTGVACAGLRGPLSGVIRNTVVNPSDPNLYRYASSFFPADGWTGQWTLQVNRAFTNPDGTTGIAYLPMPMNVCLRDPLNGTPCTPPSVPVPAAAWLFGSGLLGLAGAVRRRRGVSVK